MRFALKPTIAAIAILLFFPTSIAGTTETALPSAGDKPLAVEADEGGVWLTLDGPWAVGRLDPATRRLQTFPLAAPRASAEDSLYGIALHEGVAWTASTTRLHRVDTTTGEAESFIMPGKSDLSGGVFVADDGDVWIALVTMNRVLRFDPDTREFEGYPASPGGGPLLFARGARPNEAFVVQTYGNAVDVLDTRRGEFRTLATGIEAPTGIAYDGRDVWVGEHGGSSIVRVDPATGAFERFPVAPSPYYPISGPNGVAIASDGSVWFAIHFADRVARFDPANRTLVEYEVQSSPGTNLQHVAALGDAVWFAEWTAGKVGRAEWGGESPDFALAANASVPQTGTARLALPAGTFVANSPIKELVVAIERAELVVQTKLAPAGTYHVLVASMPDNKTYVGKYVDIIVTAANPTPMPAWLALLALALAPALALGRRRA